MLLCKEMDLTGTYVTSYKLYVSFRIKNKTFKIQIPGTNSVLDVKKSFILEGGSDMLSLNVGNSVFFEAALVFSIGKQRYKVHLVGFRSGFKLFESLDSHEMYRKLIFELDHERQH